MRNVSKNGKKKWALTCMTAGLVFVLGGCGSSSKFLEMNTSDAAVSEAPQYSYGTQNMGGSYYGEESVMEEAVTEEKGVDIDENAARSFSDRKLIKTVDLNVETKEFDLVLSTLEDQVDELGGYIEQMDSYNGSSYSGSSYRNRNASLVIRIPKEKLSGFLDTISGISNVVNRSEYVEDVTLAYVDVESRRNTLRTEQERLLALLGQAESIEDIIVIEERLSNVRYELERMESQLRTYDNKVDYSTVYLYVDEVKELTPVVEETTWERITGGFADSLKDIGNNIKEIFIWFVINIPYIVIWAVVIIVIVVITKKQLKKRRDRKLNHSKQNQNMEQEKK